LSKFLQLEEEKTLTQQHTVPCLRRASSIEEEYEAAGDEVLLDNDDDGGWLATHGIDRGMEWCSQPNVC
jgi:ubiquitin-like-conjugating enzyme ATG3